ncbi:putative receptor-like protein kinase [Camellia lanceoleosa]|uniref:Receptor-like protein kinase n=1 Tax=Camellia lanceoleosa TaxID=1840588 RepID=A0ACC0J1G8_9ERIC|nr:putative receptor-like protein kinase [Camellia lanceoleosa]
MMGMGLILLIWVSTTMCLINVSLEFNPVDNYLIDCGSPTKTPVGDRVFVADDLNSNVLSTPKNTFVNTTSKPISSTIDLALYQTARILNGTSRYTFAIKKHGRHWIRLYFFPFVDGNYNLSTAKFSVLAQDFTLLRDFQPQNGSVIKEYSLNITSDNLVLTFTPFANSFAFLNALEILSLPDELIPDGAKTIDPLVKNQSVLTRALETVARVNMGNQTVSPQNDTLWRFWVSDETYLNHVNFVNFVSKIGAVNYSMKWPTRNVAPSYVYGTATTLNSQLDPNTLVNVTWFFPVDPGFDYLVRFHFCDIVSKTPGQLFFNVYINSWLVAMNLDLSILTSNILGTPYVLDVVTSSSYSAFLNVSISPSNVGNTYPNIILNGLEIMKLSDSRGSLAVRDSKGNSKKKIWVILSIAIGVLFIAMFSALVLFVVCRRRRRSSLVDHSTEDHFAINGGGISEPMENKYASGTAIISSSKIGEMVNLVEWAMEWEKKGELEKITDPRLMGKINPDSLCKFGETAVKCLAERGIDRPTMGDVLWNLECALKLQGNDEKRPNLNGDLALETGVSTTQFNVGSVSNLEGVSMSRVFSQMVKAENRWTETG